MDINKIAKNIDTEKKFPPVHLWNPKICPGVSFKIDSCLLYTSDAADES